MKKICSYHKHEILKITQWLNEMSSYGWALDSWGVFFCEFKEYDGERFWYQLDMDNWEDGPNEERRVQLKELGWNFRNFVDVSSFFGGSDFQYAVLAGGADRG